MSVRRIGPALLCIALTVGAFLLIAGLQRDAMHARDAEHQLTSLQLDISQARDVPWGATEDSSVNDTRAELIGDDHSIRGTVATLERTRGLPNRQPIEDHLNATIAALWGMFHALVKGDQDRANTLSDTAATQSYKTAASMQTAAKAYAADARHTMAKATLDTAITLGVLLLAFLTFFWLSGRARRRAERLAAENGRLHESARVEALTDALTGLPNRRALIHDLDHAELAGCDEREQLMLVLYDLDGFKTYNDTFGHPVGDALLARLGGRLGATTDGVARAYRMGGDEFCILGRVAPDGADAIARLGAAALSETGEAFSIGCSYGIALVPHDARDGNDALRFADQRMYEQKSSGRVPSSRQSADVLLRVLAERNVDLERHTKVVADLAGATADVLDLEPREIKDTRLAAQLHDVGKTAIPDTILDKPGPLDDAEWAFIRRHTVIGERIVAAAPSLAHIGPAIRSSHERWDGGGYPDGLHGRQISISARIVAVCDAFEAMTADRPYQPAIPETQALAELQRCAGTQFDPEVVAAFAKALTRLGLLAEDVSVG